MRNEERVRGLLDSLGLQDTKVDIAISRSGINYASFQGSQRVLSPIARFEVPYVPPEEEFLEGSPEHNYSGLGIIHQSALLREEADMIGIALADDPRTGNDLEHAEFNQDFDEGVFKTLLINPKWREPVQPPVSSYRL